MHHDFGPGGLLVGVHLRPDDLRCVVSGHNGDPLHALSRPLSQDPAKLGREISAGIAQLTAAIGRSAGEVRAVGVSVPGLVNRENVLAQSPNLGWSNVFLRDILQPGLDFPLYIDNNANAFLLAAFHKFGGAPCAVVVLFTGDEEIGSPEGRPVIEAEACRARVVFNREGGRLSGNIVTRRKGAVFSKFTITGKAAHSGSKFSDGVSAIEELAHKTLAIHALTDLDRGITLNVGLAGGGQSVNTVAPSAEGQIDLRYIDPGDRDEAMTQIGAIVGHSYVAGTKAELIVRGEFLPLVPNDSARKLLDLYIAAAADSGFATSGEFDGGCADSGFAAAAGAPTICSIGPIGRKVHSADEFLLLDSLLPRVQASARTILRLEESGL